MKRTLTVNLSGFVYHIDEDAYEILSKYLDKINNSFKNKDGGKEVVQDIEARIAEIFQLKNNSSKEVINIDDVNEVISTLGNPQDFEIENEEPINDNSNDKNFDQEYNYKRLYRDNDNKIIGGVCSGIGAYFGIDPLWIRLSLLFLFFFFGSGLLVYIILWLITPVAYTRAQKLEMRGEPINIENIEKTIKQELNEVKENFNKFTKKKKYRS